MMVRTPAAASLLFPRRLWHGKREGRRLYLTFDDGPTPGVTDRVLDLLDEYAAQATFFVVGDQARRNPDLLREVRDRGHRLGNHSHTHLNGFHTPSGAYLADIAQAQSTLQELLGTPPAYFRPPYGRLRMRDARQLKGEFDIVMWEVLGGDWRQDLGPDAVAENVIGKSRPGSIVVLHDSQKAAKNVLGALPRILDHFQAEGYRFDALD